MIAASGPKPIRYTAAVALIGTAIMLSGCATPVAESPRPLPIGSNVPAIELAGGVSMTITPFDVRAEVLSVSEGVPRFGVEETEYAYSLEADGMATMTVTVRTLPQGSTIVFARADGSARGVGLLVDLGPRSLETTSFDDPDRPPAHHDPHTGFDHTTNLWGWASATGGSEHLEVLLSKAYLSRELVLDYDNGGSSRIRELIEETSGVEVTPDEGLIAIDLSPHGETCERYFLITSDLQESLDLAELDTVTRTELRWATPETSFWKAPWSIEPTTKDGYANSFRALTATQIARRYRRTRLPIYADLLINNIYTLHRLRSEDGLWRTDYTSTWVKDGTDIHAPYVDTRHNSNIMFHLWLTQEALSAADIPDIETLGEDSDAFGRYLLEKAAEGRVLRTQNGYLFYDYYNDRAPGHSHVSLNHALANLNYLLRLYQLTGDEQYLEASLMLKAAVVDTGLDWVNDAGDLHYQVDDSFTYGRKDYPTVTLNDLRLSQDLFEQILGETDPTFAELISTKEQFLAEQ